MLRRILVPILFIASITQTFSGGLVFVEYMVDQSAFAKNCVNKARPTMHCNGKCQMMKNLQAEEAAQQAPARKYENKFEVLVCGNALEPTLSIPLSICKEYNSLPDLRPCASSSSVFEPPQL
jgi:hypothetical protein